MPKIPTKTELTVEGNYPQVMTFPTPQWILQWIHEHDGGWFHPIPLTWEHPIVADRWQCTHCGGFFNGGCYAFITPFMDPVTPRWFAYHRRCSMEMVGITEEQVSAQTGRDYQE